MKTTKQGREKLMPGEIVEHTIHISDDDCRHYLQGAYASSGWGYFKGHVERLDDKSILLKRLYVEFDEYDGCAVYGREADVEIFDITPFVKAGIKPGDDVAFRGKVYPYRRKDRKRDYAIKCCKDVKTIDGYDLPTQQEEARQYAERVVCEMCMVREQCVGFCIMGEEWRQSMMEAVLG